MIVSDNDECKNETRSDCLNVGTVHGYFILRRAKGPRVGIVQQLCENRGRREWHLNRYRITRLA